MKKRCLIIQTFVLILCFWSEIYGMDISQKYFSDVSIICNETSFQNTSERNNDDPVVMNRIWLLPNGDIIRTAPNSDSLAKVHVSQLNDTSVLHIRKIDDVDFGVYWCIQVWNDSSISVVKHTVNIDGPPMHEFYEQQKKNAIVGAISAGVVLGIILLVYIVWYFQCSEKMKRKRRLTDDLAKGINRYSTQIYDNVGMELYVKRTDK
ncbi:uncharacterized protein LOC123556899 [Mercenaria mercenaria]|uniref:uncharacterized protein LOC123556899 n=1 Tax=Mercenaria mercenaria TaxID=6596 RepID=UPI00234E6EC1|nr:uncharacterized protein LOC123556899 [Mercenaria mercenaria]